MKTQKAKLGEFQSYLKQKKIDFAFFYNMHMQGFDPNFYYFSDYDGVGFLVVPKKGRPFLIVPEMEALRAKKQSCVDIVVAKGKLVDAIKRRVKSPKRIGIDEKSMTLGFFRRFRKELRKMGIKSAKFSDVGKKCLELRATKTKEEISRTRKACEITDEILSKTLFNFKKFKTEADVAAFMLDEVSKRGLQVSFKPIIASGSNGAEPHHDFTDERLKKGFCIIDFGVRYKGYCSDMTRTVYIGKPSEQELFYYGLVLEAQKKGIEAVNKGARSKKPDEAVRKTFGSCGKFFIHSTGHGIGLEIHEPPSIAKSNEKLSVGMINTIEPGLYIPKRFGIRIEDDILITEKGREIITKTGKNLLIIK